MSGAISWAYCYAQPSLQELPDWGVDIGHGVALLLEVGPALALVNEDAVVSVKGG